MIQPGLLSCWNMTGFRVYTLGSSRIVCTNLVAVSNG
jgi:hypothetical protein